MVNKGISMILKIFSVFILTGTIKENYTNNEVNYKNILLEDGFILKYNTFLLKDIILHCDAIEKEPSSIKVNKGYKLFYGEWIITKRIGINQKEPVQDIDEMIGKKFVFTDGRVNAYCYGREVQVDYPEYTIKIIPVEENSTYFLHMPTMGELGITNNYIVIFTIKKESDNGMYDIVFIIKDDETLIMFYKDSYLELKRIKHIPNHRVYYPLYNKNKLFKEKHSNNY